MKRHLAMFAALGQEARLAIFRMLVRAGPEGCCVDDIRRRARLPGSTLSHHLDTLRRCGLLEARRKGRFIYYAVDWGQATGLVRYLTEDCCAGPPAGMPVAADGGAAVRTRVPRGKRGAAGRPAQRRRSGH